MWDVAEDMKAMLIFAEHRYYGESLPFGEDTFKVSRLKTLGTLLGSYLFKFGTFILAQCEITLT